MPIRSRDPVSTEPGPAPSRRRWLAGGLLAVAGTASAQMCPRPPRARGPAVWQGLDQAELDDAYDQSVYAFNSKEIAARRQGENAAARAALAPSIRLRYGPREIEGIELFKARHDPAPLVVFIHGGAWRANRASQYAYLAEPYVRAGAHFLSVDFDNTPETDGDLFAMADQVERAIVWSHANAASFGGDPGRLFLAAHSSGSHLSACALTSGATAGRVRGAVLGSGLYELAPVRLSKRAAYVKFTDRMVETLSPQRRVDRLDTPLVLTNGTLETPEFLRQSREFHAALQAAGKPSTLLIGEGYNHYETAETLANPYGFMGRAVMRMAGLAASGG